MNVKEMFLLSLGELTEKLRDLDGAEYALGMAVLKAKQNDPVMSSAWAHISAAQASIVQAELVKEMRSA